MSLTEALKTTDLAMDAQDVEAFFLGALSADDPMPYKRALKELFLEDSKTPAKHDSPESRAKLEAALASLYKDLEKSTEKRRGQLLDVKSGNLAEQVEVMGRRGDFFLMALTLAGADVDEMDDERGALLDEMEDHLLLLDEWIAEGSSRSKEPAWTEEGEKYQRELKELWAELQEALTI